jgi:hypothetical protein
MRPQLRILPWLFLVAACGDGSLLESPTGPVEVPAVTAVAPTPSDPCTVRWAAGVNGSWFDAARWNPAGVPTSTSSVCIDAAGTYTVTLDPADDGSPVQVLALDLGEADATPTLRIGGTAAALSVTQGVLIRSGATLNVNNSGGGVLTVGGTLTNRGTFAVLAPCGGCGQSNALSADVLNEGTWNVTARLSLSKSGGAYQNLGTISVPTDGTILVPAGSGAVTFEQDGGLITGGGNLGTVTLRSGTLIMRGGKARVRSPFNPKPVVVLDGASLVLDETLADSAVIGVNARSSAPYPTITGNYGPLTTLWLAGPLDGQPGSIELAGNPTNAGLIHPVTQIDGVTGSLTIGGGGRLTNTGVISQSRSAGSQATFRYAIEVTNDRAIRITDGTHAVFARSGGVYRNNDSINLGVQSGTSRLEVAAGATLINASSGATSGGTVRVEGTLRGTGNVTSRLSPVANGVVEPGASPGILSTHQYQPDATGRLRIELGGETPGSGYDRLVSSPNLTIASNGVLEIVEIDGFLSGRCGQVFEVVTHSMTSPSNSWGPFASVTGLEPGAGRQLRVVYRSATANLHGAVSLVGFDGSQKICVGPNPVPVTEGGAGATYALALAQAPTSTVVVTVVPDAEVTVSPASLQFTTTNWQVPQFVTVTAVDDAESEGGHTGTVAHSVATTDTYYAGFTPANLTANIADNDVNREPEPAHDAVTTPEDTGVDVPVRANDADPDGDPLTVTQAGSAAHGSVTVEGGGTHVRYAPAANYFGLDSFTYTVGDGRGGSASATVNVTVTPVQDAPVAVADQAETPTPSAVVVSVLANDSDPDGDGLTVVSVAQPSIGAAEVSEGGLSVRYTPPAGFTGPASFEYSISDGKGGTASATVSVTVRPPNRAPTATNDQAVVSQGTSGIIAVLSNDSDPDGDDLTVTSVSAPSVGTAQVSGGGASVTYTAPARFTGETRFDYTIADGWGGTATATVVVTVAVRVNRDPIATSDVATLSAFGTNLRIHPLSNDSDPDGDPLTIVSVTAPRWGTAQISGRSILYRAELGAWGLQDTFEYTIADGRGGQATNRVAVNMPYDLRATDAQVTLTRRETAGNYALYTLQAYALSYSLDNVPYDYEVELPRGTFTAGGSGSSSPTGVVLAPAPNCTIQYHPGSTMPRSYRCRVDYHGNLQSQPISYAAVQFAVRLGSPANRRISVTLVPSVPDSNRRNNSRTVTFTVP